MVQAEGSSHSGNAWLFEITSDTVFGWRRSYDQFLLSKCCMVFMDIHFSDRVFTIRPGHPLY